MVGSQATLHFRSLGHSVQPISRSMLALDSASLARELEGTEAIIHLAGAPIMRRWTRAYREEIYNSRIRTTQRLTGAMAVMKSPPHTFISASAVGIYPSGGSHDEGSTRVAGGFLGDVCRDWEAAASDLPSGSRSVILRFGVILSVAGGALKQMLPPFRFGLGGPIAGGSQVMSWVHIEDVMGIVQLALENEEVSGPVNVSAPGAVTNKDFSKALGRALGRPAIMPLPAIALTLVYGRAAVVLTEGQHAIPAKAEAHGYRFLYPDIDSALGHLL